MSFYSHLVDVVCPSHVFGVQFLLLLGFEEGGASGAHVRCSFALGHSGTTRRSVHPRATGPGAARRRRGDPRLLLCTLSFDSSSISFSLSSSFARHSDHRSARPRRTLQLCLARRPPRLLSCFHVCSTLIMFRSSHCGVVSNLLRRRAHFSSRPGRAAACTAQHAVGLTMPWSVCQRAARWWGSTEGACARF